jgi:PPOX class probable F420-dependent enzyme
MADTFSKRTADRLDLESIGWLTTVTSSGTPLTSPVWFLFDGETILVYSLAGTPRTANIATNPRVSFHLDGDGLGGDVVVIEGDAVIDEGAPKCYDVPAYMDKYQRFMDNYGWTPEYFSERYPVPIRITPTRVRG